MPFRYILVPLILAIMAHFATRNSAITMIREIGHASRYYPKHYVVLKKKVRKHFRIKQWQIPKYLYFELLLSDFHLLLGVVNATVFVATGFNASVLWVLALAHVGFCIADVIVFHIVTTILKK